MDHLISILECFFKIFFLTSDHIVVDACDRDREWHSRSAVWRPQLRRLESPFPFPRFQPSDLLQARRRLPVSARRRAFPSHFEWFCFLRRGAN